MVNRSHDGVVRENNVDSNSFYSSSSVHRKWGQMWPISWCDAIWILQCCSDDDCMKVRLNLITCRWAVTQTQNRNHIFHNFPPMPMRGMRKVHQFFLSVLPQSEQRPPSALTIYRKWWHNKLTLDSTKTRICSKILLNPNLASSLFPYLWP